MGTTAQTFYPHSVDWDGTDPASGDVRTCETTLPASDSTTTANFGTSGSKTITLDPYTGGRTTTGLDSSFGWAIDIAGADGMDSTATAKRWILAGTWAFTVRVAASPAASLNNNVITANVYRVAASPSTTRTLLFSAASNTHLVTTAGTTQSWSSTSEPEIILEAGETIQVTYTFTCTGQIGGLTLIMFTGDAAGDTLFTVPSPGIKTLSEGTGTATGAGAGDGVGGKVLATVGSAAGAGDASGVLGATAEMTGTATGAGSASGVLGATGSMTGTAAGVGAATGEGGLVLGTVGTVEIGSGAATVTKRPLLIED